ncbi:MAG TPA: hypothetical protein PLM53_20365 [Spirochaetota bacterium]|nr:hypothetical protein [Spirochaetota bacterium]HQH99450.1 hypothetical protein [Spirochaetota bacterium]
MDQKLIEEMIGWLVEHGKLNPYSEAGIRIVFHEGQIRKIERLSSVKIQIGTSI